MKAKDFGPSLILAAMLSANCWSLQEQPTPTPPAGQPSAPPQIQFATKMRCQLQTVVGVGNDQKVTPLPQTTMTQDQIPTDGSYAEYSVTASGFHYGVRLYKNIIVGMVVNAVAPQTATSPSLAQGEGFELSYDPDKNLGTVIYRTEGFKAANPDPERSFFSQYAQYYARFGFDENAQVQTIANGHEPSQSEIRYGNLATQAGAPIKFYVDMYDRPYSLNKPQAATRFYGNVITAKKSVAALSTDIDIRADANSVLSALRLACRFE